MGNVGKHIARTFIKTAVPVFGKTIADEVAPLGYRSVFHRSIKGYNPKQAYDKTAKDYTYRSRERYFQNVEKVEAPFEDVISSGVQGAGLITAGALTANPMLLKAGVSRIGSGISALGAPEEKSEIQHALEWGQTALFALEGMGKKKKQKGKLGGEAIDPFSFTKEDYTKNIDLINKI